MAASLVQPTCICTCHNYAGHPHHHHTGNPYYGSVGSTGYQTIPGALPSSGHFGARAEQQHTFTTAPAISASAANISVDGVQAIAEPRVYPFKGGHIKHTHASYRRESLPELNSSPSPAITHSMEVHHAVANGAAHPSKLHIAPAIATPLTPAPSMGGELQGQTKAINSWAVCLPIPIPHTLSNITLESLTYTIRYASLNTGNASVQTDIVIAHGHGAKLGGSSDYHGGGMIVTDYSEVPLYSHYGGEKNGGGYGPPMVNEAVGLSLLSVPAFKSVGGGNQGWSHYLDHQKVYPNVRIEGNGSYAAHTHAQGHMHAQDECHMYLFFHVYEYPGVDALRSLSVDVSATWNDGEELRKAKEERAREIHDLRAEREKLVMTKKEAEMSIVRLQESIRRANEESEKRLKGEMEMEKELLEKEEELLDLEKKARESYQGRMSEEAERLRKLAEKEKEMQTLYEKRAREEAARLKEFQEVEAKAKAEHAKRMQEEEERLKEIAEAEERAKAAHERRASDEEARMKEIEEAQRKLKEETERKAKEDAERHAREEAEWKAHEAAERKAREDAERWAKEQAALRQQEEEERKARIEAERRAREEAEAAERKAKEAAARVVPSIADAPHVADEKMQEHIASVAARLGQKCKNGYAWEKKAHGYKCSGGGHFISFKDLGMN